MHRSGTSAVAGVLHQLDIPMGSVLMPPTDGENEKGFWEDERIVALHEELLKTLGMTWDDTRLMPDQWWLLDEISKVKSKLKEIIKTEFSSISLWAFKDPRTCRLIPVWHQILDELDIEPLFIHVVRNPVDVERSLARRNDFLHDKSLLLWFIYNVEAFQATSKYPRAVLSYNKLLDETESVIESVCQTLGLEEWVVNISKNKKSISDFVSLGLRHHNIGDEELTTLPSIFFRLYDLCCAQNGAVTNSFDDDVDSLAADFLAMTEIFSPWQQLPSGVSRDIDEYKNAFSNQKSVIAELSEKVDAVQLQKVEIYEQFNAWRTRAEENEQQLEAWQARAEEQENQLESVRAQNEELQTRLESWRTRAEEGEQQLESWQARATESEQQLESWQARATESEQQLESWLARAAESEQQLEAWQARALETEQQLAIITRRDVIGKIMSFIHKVLSYYRRYGLVALYKQTKQVLSEEGVRGLYSIFKKDVKKKQPPKDKKPEKINCHIDLPASGETASTIDVLTIDGWACSSAGIKSIDVFVGQQFLMELKRTLQRNDIYALFPDINDSVNSGFNGVLDISEFSEGGHELCIVIHDRDDNVLTRISKIEKLKDEFTYHNYYLEMLLDEVQIKCYLQRIHDAGRKINLKVFVLADDASAYIETIESLLGQDDFNWTCDIISDSDLKSDIEKLVSGELSLAGKINVTGSLFLPDVVDENTYLCFMCSGEMLTNNALLQWVDYLSENDVDVCYSDSDIVNPDGLHVEPNFKPDWSPDHLLSKDYIGGVFLVRNSPQLHRFIEEAPSYKSMAWRYDLLLNLTEGTDKVGHIEKVLWSKSSVDLNSKSLIEDELKCVENALLRRKEKASVETIRNAAVRKIHRSLDRQPKVSIIIPTTGKRELLVPCVESILNITEYDNYELIFLDNGRGKHPDGIKYLHDKGIKVIEKHEPFNWAKLNNDGARDCDGEILLFLNDDIEVTQGSWLTELVSHAVRDDVGAVGALLLYPDGRIQHGGVFLVDHGGGARHCLHFLNPEEPIYQDFQHVVREVSANTGACLMMRRALFEEMNGFDEELAIVGNDIDICLRVQEAGYRNIWTPECSLIHHESVSRKEVPISKDERKMWSRWGEVFLKGDPYYNPNLSNVKTDCSLRDVPPVSIKDDCHTTIEMDKSVPGINLVAYIRAEMGVGEASRSMALAMDRANIPFCVINYETGNPSRMGDHSWDHKIVSEPEYDINLFHINADFIPEVIGNLPKKFTKNRYNIGLWAWEMPEFPDRWEKSFSYLDEIWVPSEFVRKAVSEKSPIPVVTMPHSVRLMNQPYLKRMFFDLPEDRFLFLSMYDVHSIQERKNPKAAIEAYKLAFPKESSDAALVVKVNNANEAELEEVQGFIENRADIIIINGAFSRYEVDSLIACCDCFISLHRSEGFGLVLAEAMALGKPVIATNWSANQDFMSEENAACVNYSLVKLEKDYGPYDAGQHWAEPDLDHAAQLVKMIFSDRDYSKSVGEHARDSMIKILSPKKVGEMIKKRIEHINSL